MSTRFGRLLVSNLSALALEAFLHSNDKASLGMGPMAWIALLCILLFAAASMFFSLAETSLFSLSKWQTRQIAERFPPHGAAVAKLLAQPQDLLAALVLGNTLTTGAMIAVTLILAGTKQWNGALILGLLAAVILVGCEVLPKTLAVRHPERWALRLARPMQWFLGFTLPLCHIAQTLNASVMRLVIPSSVKPQTALTDADYTELLELAFQQGTLAQSEKEIILQIIGLDKRTVREVMKPRAQMVAISDDLSIEEMIAAARKHKHRRLPMYDETPDTIVGVLNTRALLLDPQADLSEVIEFPSFVPESMNLLQLLKSLQRQKRGLAIVLDEFGGTAGVVTMENILGELIGTIQTQAESPGFLMEKLGPGRWRLAGAVRIDDFRREHPAIGDVPEVDTMGGLLMSLLEVVPAPGDSAVFRGLKLTARTTDERRVRELITEVVR
jgi:CBS domain containing-hemolysin-like protein